ncbi:MAG: ATP-binding protein [Actinobacteria bacterium]|nr:ATP-binding protein [Actinomycetota bacterium]
MTLIFGLGALMLSLLLAGLTYFTARHYIISQRETSDIHQSFANASLVLTGLRSSGAKVPAVIDSLGTAPGARSVVLSDHQWYATSISIGEDSLPANFKRLVLSGQPADQLFMISGTPEFAVGIPMPSIGARYFEIFSLEDLDGILRVLLLVLAIAALVTTIAGAATGRWAAGRVLRSLVATSQAAVDIAGGNLFTKLETTGDSDLDPLFESFNQMADSLAKRIERETRFTLDVSHELRSPLTTLATTAEILQMHAHDLDRQSRQALDLLVAEISRFQAMVQELLEISTIDSGSAELSLETVDASMLVRHIAHAFARDSVPVHISPALDGLEVMVDKRRLERVFANLVDNANQHAGGLTGITAEEKYPFVRISVIDRGPGVPPDQRQKVFERFYRGRTAGRRGNATGTGLGLALALEHIKLHQGRISIESTVDGENRFVVDIPQQLAQNNTPASSPPAYSDDPESPPEGSDQSSGNGMTRQGNGTSPQARKRSTNGSRRRIGRISRTSTLLATTTLVLASCTITAQSHPTTLPRKSIPFGLMDKSPFNPPLNTKNAPVEVPVTIYLVAATGRLWPVTRDVAFPAPLDSLLNALASGPTKSEASFGLSTAIPQQSGSLTARTVGSTVEVSLSSTFGTLSGPAQIQATAQIVFTVTALSGITGVSFKMKGHSIDVPNAIGALLPGPVNRSDYAALAPLLPVTSPAPSRKTVSTSTTAGPAARSATAGGPPTS